MKRAFRVAAVLLVLGLGVLALLHTPVVRRYALRRAIAMAEEQFGIQLAAEQLRYDLMALRIELRGVRAAAIDRSGPPFFEAGRVALELPSSSVFGRQLALDALVIEGARVRIVRGTDGRINLPESKTSGGSSAPLRIGSLVIRQLAVEISDLATHTALMLPDVDATLSPESGRVYLRAPGEVRRAGVASRIHELRGGLSFDGRAIRLANVTVRTDELAATVSGDVAALADEPSVALRLTAIADAVGLSRWLAVDSKAEGTLNVTATVSGPISAPTSVVALHSPRVILHPVVLTEFTANATVSPSAVVVDRLRAQVAAGSISGNAAIQLADGNTNVALNWSDVDLEAVARMLDPTLRPRPTGRASGVLHASGPTDDLSRWTIQGRAAVAAGATSRDRVGIAGRVHLGVENSRWTLRAPQPLEVGGIAVRTSLGGVLHPDGLEKSTVRGAATIDATEVRPLAETLRRLGLLAAGVGDVDGTVEAAASIAGRIARPQIDVTANGTLANIGQLSPAVPFDDSAFVTLQSDLRVAHIEARVPSLGARAEGEVQLEPPYRANLRMSADALPLEPALRGVNTPVPITGTVSAVGSLDAPLQAWRRGRADLQVDALDARVGNLPVRLDAPARASVSGEVAEIASLDLVAGETRLSAFGRIPITGGSARSDALQITATGDLRQFLNAIGATGLVTLPELSGSGPAALLTRVTGSVERPIIAADLELGPGQVRAANLPPVTNVMLRAHSDGTWVELRDLSAEWQGSTVRAQGRAPIQLAAGGREVGMLDVRASSITPKVLEPFLDPATVGQLEGSIDASVHLRSPSLALDDVSGELRLDRMELRVANLPIAQREPTRITLRDGFAQIESWQWAGQGGSAGVRGRIRLSDRAAALIAEGRFDLRMLTPFTAGAGVSVAGTLEPRLSLTGPIDSPRIDGVAAIADGAVRLRDPRVIASDLNGSVVLTRDRAHAAGIRGQINGGDLLVSGNAQYGRAAPISAAVRLAAERMALEFPDGLHSELDADIETTVTVPSDAGDTPAGRISGSVTVLRSSYREPIAVAGGLLTALRTRRLAADAAAAEPSLVDSLALDVRIASEEGAVSIDNNIGRLALGADLRVIGTVASPALSGQAQLVEGGQLFLGRNRYEIKSGTIDFANPVAIDPILNITAATRVAGEDIDLAITGSAENLQIEPSAAPDRDLSREDLFALLLTGRTRDEISGDEAEIVGEQALAFLSGDVLGFASRAVGLDVIRLGGVEERAGGDPFAIASRVDPTARLTFGKTLARDVDVTFSQDLRDADAQTWIVDYSPRRQLEFRFVSDDENLRSYELRHDVAFGAMRMAETSASRRTAPRARRVASVVVTGARRVPEARLTEELDLAAGDEFDVPSWQSDRERLEMLLLEAGFLEARVNARMSGDESVTLTYTIVEGPRCEIEVAGYQPAADTMARIRRAWFEAVSDDLLIEEARSILVGALSRAGHIQPEVQASLAANGERKTLTAKVVPGPAVSERTVRFHGVEPALEEELRGWALATSAAAQALDDPTGFERALTAWLRGRGHARARVKVGTPRLEANAAIVPVTVDPGRSLRIATIQVEGAAAKSGDEVVAMSGLSPGAAFNPVEVEAARDRIQTQYRRDGFPDGRIEARTAVNEDTGDVALTFAVHEGPRQVLRTVSISGNRAIDTDVITRALALKAGEPVTLADWLNARRRLFETGLFRRADVTPEPMEPSASNPNEQPMRARVTVQEWPAFRLRYGFQVAEERPEDDVNGRELVPGLSADVTRRTLFGRAITLGGAMTYQRREQSGRGFLRAPTLLGLPIESSFIVERSRERFASATLVTSGAGVSWEQRVRPRRDLRVSYSYQFERNRTFDTAADPDDEFAFDLTVKVAWLNTAVAWDTRDDVADTTRGWLVSSSFDWAPASLGSDLRFVKHLGQAYYFRPWRRVVFASAARIGTAAPLGDQDLVPSERYFAGGARSVRGVAEDLLGPRLLRGEPAGGESLLVLNQEVRFPVYRWLRGVAFVDAGNVFAQAAGIRLGDLVTAYGVGLRLATPFTPLIRLDYGRLFSPRPGESRGQWFVGIGQAF